jgi:hypothetical protein
MVIEAMIFGFRFENDNAKSGEQPVEGGIILAWAHSKDFALPPPPRSLYARAAWD